MARDPSLSLLRQQVSSLERYAQRGLWRRPPPPVTREPAFDPPTCEWFRDQLGRIDTYLEFGAGASTLLAADAGVRSVSIESDRAYAWAVERALPRSVADNRIVHVDIGMTEDWGYPLWIWPTARRRRLWARYPQAGIDAVRTFERFPDLVLVDGRFRVACCLAIARAAAAANSSTRLLFDDYALRDHYWIVEQELGKPRLIGRAALFELEGSHLSPVGLDRAYRAALSDFR